MLQDSVKQEFSTTTQVNDANSLSSFEFPSSSGEERASTGQPEYRHPNEYFAYTPETAEAIVFGAIVAVGVISALGMAGVSYFLWRSEPDQEL